MEPRSANRPPALEPIRFDAPAEPPPVRVRERRSRTDPIDANACFNHTSVDKTGICAACGLSFCDRCLMNFRGETLCAPCKNYRTRLLQRRPESSKLALASFLVALAAGPILVALQAMTKSRASTHFLWLGLLLPLIALAAGVMAVRWLNRGEKRAGQHLAVSGISLAAVVAFMTMLLAVYGHKLGT